MDIEEFVCGIDNFDKSSQSQKIIWFGWYITRVLGKDRFRTKDVRACFEEANMMVPSSTSAFLNTLSPKKNPSIIRKGQEFALERNTLRELDSTLGDRPSTVIVQKLLASLPSRLINSVERSYLEEAIVCFKYGAYRAAVIMAWNLAFDHLCEHILNNKLSEFNNQLTKTYPKAKPAKVASRNDLTAFKESDILQVAKSANILSSSLYKVMKEKLDRRNIAAHPSGIDFSQLTAEEFITDLVQNVVLKI